MIPPLAMVVASPIYRGPGPLPECCTGRDPTTTNFEGRQIVQVILTNGGLHLPKALEGCSGGLCGDHRPAGPCLVALIWKPLSDASGVLARACLFSTKEEASTLRTLAPAWPWLSWLASQKPREVPLALISSPLVSQPGEGAPEEVLHCPPREARPLARVLSVCW